MKLMAMVTMGLVVATLACHSGSPPPMPDAPLHAVHDLDFVDPCDPTWSSSGAAPEFCEFACLQQPAALPCKQGRVCNDQGACMGAHDGVETMDCSATFVISDYVGSHRGCCVLRTVPDGKQVPSFFECPSN